MFGKVHGKVFLDSIKNRGRRFFYGMRFSLKVKTERALRFERYPYKDYCDRHRCIFIHIPKNAGTSIITLLRGKPDIEQEHNIYWDYLRSDPERFRSYVKFCVVRNPWTRLLSTYRYMADGGNQGSDRYLSRWLNKECKSFEDFALRWLDADKIYNIKVLNPQFMYIHNMHNDRVMVDHIIRFERIEEEFRAFQEKYGICGTLPWRNKTNRMQHADRYTSEIVDVVARYYARDISMFGYEFSG